MSGTPPHLSPVAAVLVGGPRDGEDLTLPDDRDQWLIPGIPRWDYTAVLDDAPGPPPVGVYRADFVLGHLSTDDAGRRRLLWRGWR